MRRALRLIDLLFEREGMVQALVAPAIVLAAEYWSLVFTPNNLTMAVAFTMLTPTMIAVYVYWDTLETGFEEYLLGRTD